MLQRIKSQLNVTNFVIIVMIIVFFLMRIGTVEDASTLMVSSTEANVSSLEVPVLPTEVPVLQTEVSVLPSETNTLEKNKGELEVPVTLGTLEVYNAELGRYVTINEFNKMDQEHLMMFKGVGEVTSKAILTHISTSGAMTCYEDLLDIKGIGPKKLEKILSEKP